jgi:SAM-dependent methyltransferase
VKLLRRTLTLPWDDPAMLYENRSRAESFGAIAKLYDRARPSYPPELLDALLAGGARHVLDVGCGTGIAATLLAARGCMVLGVEIDERMATVARTRGIEVEVAQFERWDARGRHFELLSSAQAWHWVDPLAGAEKAASVLEPDGRLGLFWNFGSPPADVSALLDPIYVRLAPGIKRHSVLLGGADARADTAVAGIASCGQFATASVERFAWSRTHTTATWLDLLQTHSDHQTLPSAQLESLLDAVGEAIESLGGSFELPYEAILVTALRL